MHEICLINACRFERKVLAASSHPLRTDLAAPQEQKDERSQQAYTHGRTLESHKAHFWSIKKQINKLKSFHIHPSFLSSLGFCVRRGLANKNKTPSEDSQK